METKNTPTEAQAEKEYYKLIERLKKRIKEKEKLYREEYLCK